ncbi:MAG: tetratricopeptide repeat protein [Blastopirellula sp. JB062]
MRTLACILLFVAAATDRGLAAQAPAKYFGLDLIAQAVAAEEAPSDSQTTEALNRFQTLRDKIGDDRPQQWLELPLEDRAVWLFEALHREILTGRFEAKSSAVSTALLAGDYNCVSGTILYVALADAFSLPVTPQQMEGHVWCRVSAAPPIDVESTYPQWFELSDETRRGAPGVKAGSAAAPLSRQALIAKIYYNRAVDRLETRQFASAIELLRQALRLDPSDKAAEQNWLAAKNNWAVELAQHSQFDQAERLLDEVAQTAPNYEPLLANRRHIRVLKVRSTIAAGAFSQALEKAVLDSPRYERQLRLEVYEAWLKSLVESGDVQQAKQVLSTAEREFDADWRVAVRLKRLLRSPTAT